MAVNRAFEPDCKEGLEEQTCEITIGDTLDRNVSTEDVKKKSLNNNNNVDDPWILPDTEVDGEKWHDLDGKQKTRRVVVGVMKFVAIFLLLYVFVCSLVLLADSFRLIGGKTTGSVFKRQELMQNPVVGIMIGVLATVLVQSSSTSTSIAVSMVAGGIIDVHVAIPIIMGANIGTSVTNTIVSLGQIADRSEFRRAFAAATVHDMFNWLTVMVLLPVEIITGYLQYLSGAIVSHVDLTEKTKSSNQALLKYITKPVTSLVVQLDKKVLKAWSIQNEESSKYENVTSMLKVKCKGPEGEEKCVYLFANTGLSDSVIGAILLTMSLLLLCVCLVSLVKLLHSMLKGSIARVIKSTLNADLPKVPWLTGYIAIVVGCLMTILVQSSSIFTSALTPLVGIGVISLDRVYPLTLGSNIGTTTTALLAALAADADHLRPALQLALCHLMFNVSGLLIFYVIPVMRVPVKLAKMLGNTTARYRWFALVYLFGMFFVFPGFVFLLSLGGKAALIGVGIPVLLLFIAIVVINILQAKKSEWLPGILKTWTFLPEPLRSLEPYDRMISKLVCCKRCKQDGAELKPLAKPVTLNSCASFSAV